MPYTSVHLYFRSNIVYTLAVSKYIISIHMKMHYLNNSDLNFLNWQESIIMEYEYIFAKTHQIELLSCHE